MFMEDQTIENIVEAKKTVSQYNDGLTNLDLIPLRELLEQQILGATDTFTLVEINGETNNSLSELEISSDVPLRRSIKNQCPST